MKELLSVGFAVIDKIGDKEHYGGSATGVAINGKKLGLDTGLLALFGDDPKSREYYSYLVNLGIDLAQSHLYPNISIPRNQISHIDRTAGWTDDGVTQYMDSAPLDASSINAYEVVHLASAHFNLAGRVANNREGGILTYSPGPKLRTDPAYLDLNALRRSEIVFLNEEEWQHSRQLLQLERPGDLIEYGPKVVVTTHGKDGSVISHREHSLVEEHVSAQKLNDGETTGAGDALSLGFILGYINRLPLKTCGEIGTTLAFHALQRNGVIMEDTSLKKFAIEAKQRYGIQIQ